MKLKQQLKLQKDIEVPFHVWTCFGRGAETIFLSGDQARLTDEADYKTLEQLRAAIDWYADQLGGKVKWSK